MRRSLLLAAIILATALPGLAGCAGRAAPAGPVPPQSVYKVRAALLNLLECPSLTCPVTEDLHDGQEVAVLSPRLGDWVQVRVLPGGREGYVLARFLGR
ncbi:hypothetical protein DFW101_1978 [Solidesulfovibrio carbinoliphilus subsp. oakridgensis]|uniref:SH3b domain-containing protein n=1 Tax=Solidesulfovibrio carbinoliphilus subsp. oakridgensis TaxID=694327 RepID=G7Q6P9_9BACT|nr:SH3 domain-containing protein [Solidesulfovibrio carbinoliphilus]EHJ47984.1 hypothetical protein DFW101_1978 [Solidesulfovibrio carbinoliphilus subsp. oakridgensis]